MKEVKDMLVDYCFELACNGYVFVEDEEGKDLRQIRVYLESQTDDEVIDYLGVFSVEEAEAYGYDTF